jgi:hypothetical protein
MLNKIFKRKPKEDPNSKKYQEELAKKFESFQLTVLAFKGTRFYEEYVVALDDLVEAVKQVCIIEQDIEKIRGYQAQYGMLKTILGITENVNEPTTSDKPGSE